jgi:hypothetical protein
MYAVWLLWCLHQRGLMTLCVLRLQLAAAVHTRMQATLHIEPTICGTHSGLKVYLQPKTQVQPAGTEQLMHFISCACIMGFM